MSPGFLLLCAAFLCWEGRAAVAVLAAMALHEGMHLAVLRRFGGHVGRLRLTLGGAYLSTEQGGMGYGGELLAVLAGPGINLLLALLAARAGERWYLFSGVNLALGCFNLLPLPGLDGWRVLRLLAALLLDWAEG